ncbi:bile acid:sodium symporter family protein [Croceicoccus bisphenolivorans]|uniref:bile acid:sodium symporter family protein n=1 Tax=Croceicoccus bisphenolivorans TaxID=1783232 RepID=UPI00082A9CE8|nr:bile acid:sodium symporter family protein [Croceicoccus bisphenolivorans]
MTARLARIDPFLLVMIVTVIVASLLPVSGEAAVWAGKVTNFAIALLFFLHGAKLSRQAILQGIGALKVHLLVFIATFAMFPLLGIGVRSALSGLVDATILAGVVFLAIVPSTVQSSIAFTSIAGGNVPAAICSASISNLAGIFLTPLLAALLLAGDNGAGVDLAGSAQKIAMQLLVPFIAGHLARPVVGKWIDRYKSLVAKVDRSSILLVVYTAFSAAVVEGLWSRVGLVDLALILIIDSMVLAIMILAMLFIGKRAGLSRENSIVLVFAGSKKSLASGVPMAGALFPAALVGPIILPLMLFHQIQLMVCSAMASHYAKTQYGVQVRGSA